MKRRTGIANKIATELREMILGKRLKIDEPLVSVRTLAQSYGVALKTADRALNQLAEEGLIYRRQGSGSFVKNTEKRQRVIGLVVVLNPVLEEELVYDKWSLLKYKCDTNIIKYFEDKGFVVRVISYHELAISSGMRNKSSLDGLDGVLVSGARHSPKVMAALGNCPVPVVIYGTEYPVPNFSYSVPDYNVALKDLFKRFDIDAFDGCLMFHEKHDNAIVRKKTFFAAALRAGFSQSALAGVVVEVSSCYRTVTNLLDRLRGKLIISSSDYLSEHIVYALRDAGLEPGIDMELVSFDGFESQGFAPFDEPTLTAIEFPLNGIRDAAAKLLETKMDNDDGCQHIVKVPSKLTIRRSALCKFAVPEIQINKTGADMPPKRETCHVT